VLFIPAVDIRNGKAVRLVQGRSDRETVYSEDPVEAALRWDRAGARRIHVVDLDGAFSGEPRNMAVTLAIIKAVKAEVEVGGGLRTAESVLRMLDAGAARCVIGTKAAEDRPFLERLASARPGRISIGIDARNGIVATRGWTESSRIEASAFAAGLSELPLAEIIYTDIERDGMLEGPNFERIREMQAASPFPVIASGGVSTLADIRRLKEMGVFGCIVGKALYDGRLDIGECLAAAGKDE
jgi:phosphoribosylformimino-5-aminoimidazole carboxamide ribotide isomerase